MTNTFTQQHTFSIWNILNQFIFRIACFITGRSYEFLKKCSIKSRKRTMTYFAGILIVSIIWFFVGYEFSRLYLHLNELGSKGIGILCVFIVMQIERIIINGDKATLLGVARFLLALIMSLIGSLIIDQFIFQDDINKLKNEHNEKIIESRYNKAIAELTKRKSKLEYEINKKTDEMNELAKKIRKNKSFKDSTRFYSEDNSPLVNLYNIKKSEKENYEKELKNIIYEMQFKREQISKEVNSYKGLLDELQILVKVITKSWLSIFVYLIIFLFFLFLELLVVMNKYLQDEDDYDFAIKHQLQTFNEHFRKMYEIPSN
ncbi:MAG: hypothetical protein KatS3mg027_2336 [Bacteroidia bacterium]|nr:MAG: hypothetical protein KatS3mg027_2336 [Bacteroidia bacterium]